jgi:hypothetical protein
MSWRFYPLEITKRRGILDDGETQRVARFLSLQQAKSERICEQRKAAKA